jgi:hypothetical protein
MAERILYVHDGALAHCSRAVQDVLNSTYHVMDRYRRAHCVASGCQI